MFLYHDNIILIMFLYTKDEKIHIYKNLINKNI